MNKKKLICIIIGLLLYVIFMVGGTYAYLYVTNIDDNTLTGNLAVASIELSVERIVPTTDMKLVPLLDGALGNALKGTGGISSCVDANNNLSCEVYKIEIYNPSLTNLRLSGDITLVSSGENNIYNNLKWELLDNVNSRKSVYQTNGMETSFIEKNFYLASGELKIYYIALWISENGLDQRETDKGTYGGIVNFYNSIGEGVTAHFGSFDEDYCSNNGFTKLSDCLLITEKYSSTVDEAKTYISNKVADFTNTAPIVTYISNVETNVTGTSIFRTSTNIRAGTSYTFDSSTGNYTLSNHSRKSLEEAVSDEDATYYICLTNYYCATMYVVYDITSSTNDNITTYSVTKADIYNQTKQTENLSGQGLYVTEDDYGDSYYFRGKVENNYLSFAGFIWRIVRINGDGNIRVIYSGTSTSDTGSDTSIGTSYYNYNTRDTAMAGYKYGLSQTLQHTTATNLSYMDISSSKVYYFGDDYIADDSTKQLSISGNITSGTLSEVWGSGDSNYKYTCFKTTSSSTCSTLIEIKSYLNETLVKVNYHSYLSESYESTFTNELDSTIKTVIDNWYKTNIDDKGYSNYLQDTLFCNDRSLTSGDGFSLNNSIYYGAHTRNNANRTPSLKCPRKVDQFTVNSGEVLGNGTLTYPIGLISIDEVVFAGAKYNTINDDFYLYTGQAYWTMSPSHLANNVAYIRNWHIKSDGRIGSGWLTSADGVRPVINLTSEILVTSGNGTASSPYTIALPSS